MNNLNYTVKETYISGKNTPKINHQNKKILVWSEHEPAGLKIEFPDYFLDKLIKVLTKVKKDLKATGG